MTSFLWWIGWYNFLGSLVLVLMYHERIADVLLRKVTEVATLAVYVLMYLVMAVGMRPPKYSRRGAIGLHVLWLAQIAWGSYSLFA
jgi:hypothetical protein